MLKLFHKISHEIVTVLIDDKNITCAWFKKSKKINNFFNLNAYEQFPINNFQIYNLAIFNSKQIKDIIHNFLLKYNLEDAFIYLSLSGKEIKDKIIAINNENNNETQSIEKSLAKSFYHFHHLDGQDLYYNAQIPHSLIFQYKIFSIIAQINIAKITTVNASLIRVLKYFKFDISSIKEINNLHNYFENFIESYDINNCIFSTNINLIKEKSFIFKSLGLFLIGNNYE